MQAPIYHSSVSKPTSPPLLPPELVSQILSELWDKPQSHQDRTSLIRTICGVNRTWLGLFARITLRDVHLPLPMNAESFLRLLPEGMPLHGEGDLFTIAASQVANQICHSLTFHVDGRPPPAPIPDSSPAAIKVYSSTDRAANTVSSVLYMVTMLGQLPNLRHINIKYTDWGYENIFDQLGTAVFPSQVTHLSVDYSFSAPALVPLAVYLKSMYRRLKHPRVTLPNVRCLSVSGVPMEFVADMLQVCPNVETLEVTSASRLFVLGRLPLSVRTLVLRHPGVALDQQEMGWWMLEAALEGGLLQPGAKLCVVLRSSTPDPKCFAETRRICKRYGAAVVFERDESSDIRF